MEIELDDANTFASKMRNYCGIIEDAVSRAKTDAITEKRYIIGILDEMKQYVQRSL